MKTLLLSLTAAVLLASCCKERDYLCTVTNVHPEGIVYRNTATVPFRGTPAQARAFEAARTFGDSTKAAPWQHTSCK